MDSCLQRITSVPLAHVLEEVLKVCGHNILQLWMKSPVNLAVPCVQRTAKVARPVLRFPSVVVFERNVWELHANQHFQNWRPWHCDTRFCLRAKHIDGETGGAYGTNWNKRNMRTSFCYKKQEKTPIREPKKAIPLPLWTGPEGSRSLRLPDFKRQSAQEGGKVSPTHRPPLPPGNIPGTHLC